MKFIINSIFYQLPMMKLKILFIFLLTLTSASVYDKVCISDTENNISILSQEYTSLDFSDSYKKAKFDNEICKKAFNNLLSKFFVTLQILSSKERLSKSLTLKWVVVFENGSRESLDFKNLYKTVKYGIDLQNSYDFSTEVFSKVRILSSLINRYQKFEVDSGLKSRFKSYYSRNLRRYKDEFRSVFKYTLFEEFFNVFNQSASESKTIVKTFEDFTSFLDSINGLEDKSNIYAEIRIQFKSIIFFIFSYSSLFPVDQIICAPKYSSQNNDIVLFKFVKPTQIL